MVGRNRKKNNEVGQAMVEWALVFPVLLLLVFGIIDFSWLGYQRMMFESSFQMTAWDFALILKEPGGGGLLSDTDVLYGAAPDTYDMFAAEVVAVNGAKYALGDGIKEHMLKSSLGFLEADKLTVASATAEFENSRCKDYYNTIGSGDIMVESFQLKANLVGSLEYKVKFLTPVGRIFNPSGEVILKKNLVRERTERVVIKRRVKIPASTE